MATIKRLSSKGSIKNIINYVLSKEKTDDRIISGKDCSPLNATMAMNATKNLYDKTEGITYHHIIQSFKPGEITPEKAHKIGMELAEKGLPIWKEQLRSAIDEAKEHSKNMVEVKGYLKENFNIEMKIQNKNVSYLHPDKEKYCRGDKLGGAYTKEGVSSEFEKIKESPQSNKPPPLPELFPG